MKILKKIVKAFGYFSLFLLILFFISFKKLDRTSYKQTAHYKAWKKEINAFSPIKTTFNSPTKVGWAKVNITPPLKGPMAGYGKRRGKFFEAVHDSVFVRAMAFQNGVENIFLVSADMLIVPPNVTSILFNKLDSIGISTKSIHLSATHTHNSLGGWGKSITGKLFAGNYDQKVEQQLASQFLKAILSAKNNQQEAEIIYAETLDKDDIQNRLNGVVGTTIDPEIRTINIKRLDGNTAKFITYAAHSTVLNSATMQLSRDYSGVLIDSLELKQVNFAMFMAGAVGSMGPIEKGADDFDEVNNQAIGILNHLPKNIYSLNKLENIDLQSYKLALPLRDPNPKIFKNWGLRPWLFKILFGDELSFLKITKINNTILIGLPCDFSGELMNKLDNYAKSKGFNLIVTSFNGGYIGYVTDDKHFDLDLYETTTMAWFGTENGAYFTEIIIDVLDKLS